MNDQDYKKLAEAHGVIFVGMQTWKIADEFITEFALYRFPKDECNGTSFAVNTGESMEGAKKRVRSMFRKEA